MGPGLHAALDPQGANVLQYIPVCSLQAPAGGPYPCGLENVAIVIKAPAGTKFNPTSEPSIGDPEP